jgi:hypothetical protein
MDTQFSYHKGTKKKMALKFMALAIAGVKKAPCFHGATPQ